MYTVRDDAARDFVGTLKRVADLGYAGVELAGTGGLAARELRKVLDDLGLRVAGSHVGMEQLEGELAAALDYAAEIGNANVVCPYIGEERRKDADGYRRLADQFNRIGLACKARGMTFSYHNHAFEFERFGDLTGLEILFGATDPTLVKSELDVYWIQYGGEDPVAFIAKLAGRVPLVHLKDMADNESRSFAEIGEGMLDWHAICSAAEQAGAEWFLVEQDVCKRPPMESAELSLRNLRSMGLA
jgi:sugar phosphate isomerase/epimerase